VGQEVFLASRPVTEINRIEGKGMKRSKTWVFRSLDLNPIFKSISFPAKLDIVLDSINNFSVEFSNEMNEKLIIGFDTASNEYFIDRSRSGRTDFFNGFAARHAAPRLIKNREMDLTLYLDKCSVELFADKGLTTMTELFFPTQPYQFLKLLSGKPVLFKKIEYIPLSSIWP
jgi:fructan beta-fructosidase